MTPPTVAPAGKFPASAASTSAAVIARITTEPAANVWAAVPSCARRMFPSTPEPSVRVPTLMTSRLPEESISTALNQSPGDAQLLVFAAGKRSAFDAPR
jgi:hypothetical protein